MVLCKYVGLCWVVQHADLEAKNDRLQQLAEEQERTRQLQLIAQEKIKKDVEMVKKQLQHERSLKRDAFQRVEELQTEVVMFCVSLGLLVALHVCKVNQYNNND